LVFGGPHHPDDGDAPARRSVHALIGLAAVLVAASALYGPQGFVSACPITFMVDAV